MPVPQPLVALTGGCSVVFNNTLYSYSTSAFQSLALEEDAEWKTLPDGQSVKGGVCVGSTPKDSSEAAMFVVGGKSNSSEYPGLQKFTYATGKWETLTPQVPVTKDRVYHSATYINSSDSILVYSGSTDGHPNLSSQTFAISASEPHDVLAFQSTISPPGVAPILLPWSETQVAMIGGNPTNTKVMLFEASTSWTDSGVTLAEPLPKNTTYVKATIIQGDDGSKHLYTFDATTSPNTVNRTVLIDANGAPMANAAPTRNNVAGRDLTMANWPRYNSTLAPKATRSDYSLASDSNGLIVMSGGNEDDVLTIFDGKTNSWTNMTALFGSTANQVSIQSEPTSTSSTSASTVPTTSSSQTVAAPGSSQEKSISPTTILGVVLGVVLGVAAILIIILLVIRQKRKKRAGAEAGQMGQTPRGTSGGTDDKAFFQQQNIQPPSGGYFQGHKQQDSAGSFSSMAILMGKAQQPAVTNDAKRNSTSSVFCKQFKSKIGRPQLQSSAEPEFLSTRDPPRDEKLVSFTADTSDPKPRSDGPPDQDGNARRSSGWNRYWSTGSSLNILGFTNNGESARRDTDASAQSSFYSEKNRMTQDSATVPALQVEGRPSFSHVHSASPTVSEYNPSVPEMSGQIERPVSAVSALSAGYSSGIPASVQDEWDPVISKKPWGSERAPSSAYSQSIVGTNCAYTTALGAPTSRQPTGISTQPQLFKASTSDMSWLNLGDKN
ncbi:hypothetical protein F5X99DRAFT_42109 [Biscogniauxia marginata]|nr:hypothetical protein F5X99DRAFT_42109 [Biscogniauxia marginata]